MIDNGSIILKVPSGTFTATPQTIPAGGGSVTLTWTSQNATSASIDQGIGLVALNGSRTVNVTSAKMFTLTLSDSMSTVYYYVTVAPYATSLTLAGGWNLVSIPNVQLNYTAGVVFPGKIGSMYMYNTATRLYQIQQTLANGPGYWVNYASPTTVIICGSATGSLSVTAAQPGWVLVGSREIPIQLSSLILTNDAAILSSVFRYNPVLRTYQATNVINPGDVCWVNVSKACTIILP